MRPAHEHDCEACQHIGTVQGPAGPVDLYRCPKGAEANKDSFIARYSSDAWDYSSGPGSVISAYPPEHYLSVALHAWRALETQRKDGALK